MDRYNVIISDEAERDILCTYEYIANTLAAPQAAGDLFSSIQERIISLGYLPERYPLCDHYDGRVRKMPVHNYLVLYRINGRTVEIIRVLYTKMKR